MRKTVTLRGMKQTLLVMMAFQPYLSIRPVYKYEFSRNYREYCYMLFLRGAQLPFKVHKQTVEGLIKNNLVMDLGADVLFPNIKGWANKLKKLILLEEI